MSTIDVFLGQLEKRLNIHVVQQILRESNVLSARSWAQLHANVKGALKKDPSLMAKLQTALVMQQLCDLKAIVFYELPAQVAASVEVALKSAKVSTSPLATEFPLDVAEAVLVKDDGNLKIVHKFEDNFGCGIVLSRRRRFSISKEYAQSSLTPAVQSQFPNAEKIIEVTYFNKQTYDVVYLNSKSGMLEVRADCTRESGQNQTAGQLRKSLDEIRAYSNNFVSKAVQGYNLGHPINLLPLAKKAYEDFSGVIKKIGFATDDESVKRETMKAGEDLRAEVFHKTGAQAIGHNMSIFEVAIQWHDPQITGSNSGSKPEIYIPGSHREYVKMNARTDFLFVRGIRTYADSNFIIEKIKSYK